MIGGGFSAAALSLVVAVETDAAERTVDGMIVAVMRAPTTMTMAMAMKRMRCDLMSSQDVCLPRHMKSFPQQHHRW